MFVTLFDCFRSYTNYNSFLMHLFFLVFFSQFCMMRYIFICKVSLCISACDQCSKSLQRSVFAKLRIYQPLKLIPSRQIYRYIADYSSDIYTLRDRWIDRYINRNMFRGRWIDRYINRNTFRDRWIDIYIGMSDYQHCSSNLYLVKDEWVILIFRL